MAPKDGQPLPLLTASNDDLEAGEANKKDMFSNIDNNNNSVTMRTLYYTLSSNIFFVLASMLYVWLAVVGMHYEEEIKDIPAEISQADDDYTWYGVYDYGYQDDYVFVATKRDVYVSRYQILYFAAAICFVVTGVMDLLYKPGLYGGVMFFAGSFGLLSAIFLEKDEWLATVFNSVSVHLFLIEAAALLYWRKSWPGLRYWFLVADALFLMGALLDVILSYVILRDHYNHALSRVTLVASICWLITALLYFYTTLYMYRDGFYSGSVGNMMDKELQINKDAQPQERMTTTWVKTDQTTEVEMNSEKQSDDLAAENSEI